MSCPIEARFLFAMLLVDGEYGQGPDSVDDAAAKAIASARALIARQALRPA